MGWVEEQFEEGQSSRTGVTNTQDASFESRIGLKWQQMLEQLRSDVAEFRRLRQEGSFEQLTEWQCSISNPGGHIVVVITTDPALHTMRYRYLPEAAKTAVPEEGVITFRSAGNAVLTYSSDQRLSLEQLRQLILEPVFFPAKPTGETAAA